MTQTKPKKLESHKASELLGLIHSDVCGPMSVEARGGYSYFITFTDDRSRFGRPNLSYLKVWRSPAYVKALTSEDLLSHGASESKIELKEVQSPQEQIKEPESAQQATLSNGEVNTQLRRSTRVSQPPERYGYVIENQQTIKDDEPCNYEETIKDVDSSKWLEAMRSEIDSMHQN
ncbi:uncharacterized protein LOC133301307 [Gastrolobium bilobum]|uniref:uncharacterized protein LOC133301307 n=1 Tax=Gastrolobium bilobum TaxID=150636 RepID=UPI002AAF2BBE|nr:uncharacterized protein LOC133301307 [Gastrolobium bilobum]